MNEIIFNFIINLNEFVSAYYIYSFCLFFIISTLYFTFSLPGGIIILLSSGFFFGFIGGFFLNIISICLGSLIFIIFSKTLLRGLKNIMLNFQINYLYILKVPHMNI